MTIKLLDVGRMSYDSAWELQKRLVSERTDGSLKEDALIIVEHDHVITLGRKTTPENFKPQDIPVFQVERGETPPTTAPASSLATQSSGCPRPTSRPS